MTYFPLVSGNPTAAFMSEGPSGQHPLEETAHSCCCQNYRGCANDVERQNCHRDNSWLRRYVLPTAFALFVSTTALLALCCLRDALLPGWELDKLLPRDNSTSTCGCHSYPMDSAYLEPF
jgi:hypothetical protein